MHGLAQVRRLLVEFVFSIEAMEEVSLLVVVKLEAVKVIVLKVELTCAYNAQCRLVWLTKDLP